MPVFVIPCAINRSTSCSRSVSWARLSWWALAVEQRGDHLRVERRASVGDSCDGAEEVRNVQHPVLQQITEPTETGKLHAVRGLDVLREEEDTQVGPRRFERGSRTGALVGE